MFSFTKNDSADSDGSKDMVTSIIGKDMHISGDITFKGKMRLDGKAEGNIRGEYLILGESGSIVGDVAVAAFVCSGQVEGNVNVKKLHVIKGGTINGTVETSDMEVESGAVLNGEIKSRSKDIRLVPGSSIPREEWEAKVQEVAVPKEPESAKNKIASTKK